MRPSGPDTQTSRLRRRPEARAVGAMCALLLAASARVVAQPDLLTWFYRVAYGTAVIFRPLLPRPKSVSGRPGPLGRVFRGLFAGTERVISLLLRDRR